MLNKKYPELREKFIVEIMNIMRSEDYGEYDGGKMLDDALNSSGRLTNECNLIIDRALLGTLKEYQDEDGDIREEDCDAIIQDTMEKIDTDVMYDAVEAHIRHLKFMDAIEEIFSDEDWVYTLADMENDKNSIYDEREASAVRNYAIAFRENFKEDFMGVYEGWDDWFFLVSSLSDYDCSGCFDEDGDALTYRVMEQLIFGIHIKGNSWLTPDRVGVDDWCDDEEDDNEE